MALLKINNLIFKSIQHNTEGVKCEKPRVKRGVKKILLYHTTPKELNIH